MFEIKSDKKFVNTLEDSIQQHGVIDKLRNDSAQVEITSQVKDILRTYAIDNWISESGEQKQKPAERKYQQVKHTTNHMMERTGSSANTWLLAIIYVCYLIFHTASQKLH